jgi:hypothetical protein
VVIGAFLSQAWLGSVFKIQKASSADFSNCFAALLLRRKCRVRDTDNNLITVRFCAAGALSRSG